MPSTARPAPSLAAEPRGPAAAFRIHAEVAAMVAASTLVGLAMAPHWGTGPVDLLYLPPVLAAASLYGLRPALFAAFASTLAYNFFFTEPLRTFRIDKPADLVTVSLLLLVALVTSQLAARMRAQARIAAANAARNATIAGLARRLLSCASAEEVGEVACAEIGALFGCNAVLVAPGPGVPRLLARRPASALLTPSDFAAAALALESGEPAGRGAPRLDPAEWLFHPVRSGPAALAALGLARDDGGTSVPEEGLALLGNLLDQVALALERVALEAQARDAAVLRERDRLRGALLSSVGHDLRTPLTAILAAVAGLPRIGDGAELGATIAVEAAKLERYISNLLDMARIEAGTIRLKDEPTDLVDAVSAALRDLRGALEGRKVEIEIGGDLPLVRADPSLLHHMLINLIDNAARHGGKSSPIHVSARRAAEGSVVLNVADEGPGLGGQGDALFETFRRSAGSDRSGGAGLGLGIVKAFAEAMEVQVSARDRQPGPGAEFSLTFPAGKTYSEQDIGQAAEDIDR